MCVGKKSLLTKTCFPQNIVVPDVVCPGGNCGLGEEGETPVGSEHIPCEGPSLVLVKDGTINDIIVYRDKKHSQ